MVFNLSLRPLLFLRQPLLHQVQWRPFSVSASVSKAIVVSRTRRTWTDEESERLLDLVKNEGPRWTYLTQFFDNRSSALLANRYKYLTDKTTYRGPWTREELEALKNLTRGAENVDSIDWEFVRAKLPRPRDTIHIQLTWKHSINPRIRHGRWSEDEIERLDSLVRAYGIEDWGAIADGMGTRTRRQCLERWRWQQDIALQKGRFTEEEDKAIMKAVKEYGENWALVKDAIGSKRTARHISQHYQYMLNQNTDRSPWSPEEENTMYDLALKFDHDMSKVKKVMDSKRSPKDMWNHFYKVQRIRRSNAALKKTMDSNSLKTKVVEGNH